MALRLRRHLPLVVGPLIFGFGFHAARQQFISNDTPNGNNSNGGSSRNSNGDFGNSLLNPAQVSARLRQHDESLLIERGDGVLRYDFAQLGSNSPIEDDHSERIVSVPIVTPDDHEYSTDWYFWGIFDGHGGFSTSAKLREALVSCVISELNKVYLPVAPGSPNRLAPGDPSVVSNAITTAFTKLDDEIVHGNISKLLNKPSRQAAVELLPPALSGSCALLAFYDSAHRDLRVALAGDSRAVLGTRTKRGVWQARSLTADQTGSNEDEVHRIRSEHPKSEQDTCVRRGRVLGIYEPTRSFGDGAVKWSRETQRKLGNMFFSTRLPSALRTPPYMTAEPVITHTHLDVEEEPGFLVLASDGLFEMLGSDQVVGLVVDWMQQRQPVGLETVANGDNGRQPSQGSTVRGADRIGRLASLIFRNKLRRHIGDPIEDVTEHKESLKQPVYQRTAETTGESSNANGSNAKKIGYPAISVQDSNAATHLIRNALGGADHEQVSMLLSIAPPMSRNYRDDVTVTVVFFGKQEENTGAVRLNPEGTFRSKL